MYETARVSERMRRRRRLEYTTRVSLDQRSISRWHREATFIIAKKKIDDLQRSGPTLKFLELHLVKETLDSPDVIFQDLKREDLRDSHGYSKVRPSGS